MHPGDPRNRVGHRERSFQKYYYTVQDIALATGLSITTVRAYSAGKRQQFNIADLSSVATFVVRHQAKGCAPES